MPWGLTRFHHSGQSHFVTFCCYDRHRSFTTDASRRIFESALERAVQVQTSRLRVRRHAGACSPPAQRTTTGYAGRCAEVVEAGSSAAIDRQSPSRAKGRLEWGTRAFLAEAVLRFQHSKLSAVCGVAALHASQYGEGRFVRTSGGRTSGGNTLSSSRTAPHSSQKRA